MLLFYVISLVLPFLWLMGEIFPSVYNILYRQDSVSICVVSLFFYLNYKQFYKGLLLSDKIMQLVFFLETCLLLQYNTRGLGVGIESTEKVKEKNEFFELE